MGFQHQKIYKIQSVADGNFLDLGNQDTAVGTKIQTWPSNNTGAQRWLVNEENMDNGTLYYNNNHGYLNQQFYADGIGNGKFLIKSTFDYKAIKNQGPGVQVKCVAPNPNDVSQQWRIHRV